MMRMSRKPLNLKTVRTQWTDLSLQILSVFLFVIKHDLNMEILFVIPLEISMNGKCKGIQCDHEMDLNHIHS